MDKKYKHKVTYWLGAGASANALPIVKASDKFPSYADSLEEVQRSLASGKSQVKPPHNKFIDSMCHDFYWLMENAKSHQSIDGFCMWCYNEKKFEDLNRAKNVISFYFVYKQIQLQARDNRYAKFLHELMVNQEGVFPENVKILNWNYDFQMQYSSDYYANDERNLLHYYPCLNDCLNYDVKEIDKNFQMIHLNGIAGFYAGEKSVMSDLINPDMLAIDTFVKSIHKSIEKRKNLLTFAFEQVDKKDEVFDRHMFLEQMIRGTDTLVVIGYSFDSVNHNTDRRIFQLLKSGRSLQKIYIQNPSHEELDLYDRFDLEESHVKIKYIHDCTTFKVPYEVKKLVDEDRVFSSVFAPEFR